MHISKFQNFGYLNVSTYRCEVTVSPLFKNSTNKIPSLSQKPLAMTSPAQVCASDLSLVCTSYVSTSAVCTVLRNGNYGFWERIGGITFLPIVVQWGYRARFTLTCSNWGKTWWLQEGSLAIRPLSKTGTCRIQVLSVTATLPFWVRMNRLVSPSWHSCYVTSCHDVLFERH